jgi:hypothetical protein
MAQVPRAAAHLGLARVGVWSHLRDVVHVSGK